MNLDELQKIWNSTGNRPTAEQSAQLLKTFAARVRRRRRQELAWLIWTFFLLSVLTGFAGWLIFGTTKVNLLAEWAVIPLLAIPWFFASVFLRRFLKSKQPSDAGDMALSDSLSTALAVNKAERGKLKIVGLMYLIAIPVLAGSIWQLESVGKISPRELVSMVTFFGVALLLSASAVLARYWLGLIPEQRRLKTLIAQFEC